MYRSGLIRLNDPEFRRLLLKFDEDLAREARAQGCADCRGKLHAAPYLRKPRGTVVPLDPEYCVRFSFCCAVDGCRHRATPPSLRFLGPKLYPATVVVLVAALRCGATGKRIRLLKKRLGVSRQTLQRWQRWWREVLPETAFWRLASGALRSAIPRCELPRSLLDQFTGTLPERVLALLRFIGPLTGGQRCVQPR